jgi:gamma-glutamyltranspeptidase
VSLSASVAAPHPAALGAARAAHAAGGNAYDLAVAAASALAVAYPHQNSIGGDLIGLVREPDGTVTALLSAGAAPQRIDVDALRAAGERMPSGGPDSITVPGILAGWAALAQRGNLPLSHHLRAAAALAADGVPVVPGLAAAIVDMRARIEPDPGLAALFLPGGRPLTTDDVLVQPALARTLTTLAAEGPSALYGGTVGADLTYGLRRLGCTLGVDDLSAHAVEWAAPLTTRALGATWHVAPPPSQGATLAALVDAIERDGLLTLAAVRAANASRDALLGDPRRGPIDVASLTAAIVPSAEQAAAATAAGAPRPSGDTVGVAAADADGTLVVFLQSVYQHFGAAILEPETGIVLHNRGSAFSLVPGHPGELAGGARPPHTLCPAIAELADGTIVAAGAQGGRAQPQVLAQLAPALAEPDSDLDTALARPRWVVGGRDVDRTRETVLAEPGAIAPRDEAAAAGVAFDQLEAFTGLAGHAQVVRFRSGSLSAASDPRADGAGLSLPADQENAAP